MKRTAKECTQLLQSESRLPNQCSYELLLYKEVHSFPWCPRCKEDRKQSFNKLKQEWLIHIHRTKQSAKQNKTQPAFLISVSWLSLVIDTKSSPELKLHEIVHPKKLNISPRRGTENNQTERYGEEVSRVSPSSEEEMKGFGE